MLLTKKKKGVLIQSMERKDFCEVIFLKKNILSCLTKILHDQIGEQYAIAVALIEAGEVVVGVLGCPNLQIVGNAGERKK